MLATLVVACGGAPPVDTEPPMLETYDRCTVLPRECIEGFDFSDDDGCPDPPTPEVAFARGDARLATDDALRTVNEVALDGMRLWPGAKLRLVAVGADDEPTELGTLRVAVVRAALIAAGVPEDRIREGSERPPGIVVPSVRIAVDDCAM